MSLLGADPREIMCTLELLMRPGEVHEIRIPKTSEGTVSGYFNNHESVLKAITELNVSGPGTYILLNPCTPDLLARAYNRLKTRVTTTTSDRDILQRHWIPVDVDPVRPSGISSSDAEHNLALDRCRQIRFDLSEDGWPQPIAGDSANGGHLLYAADLPNDPASEKLIERFLKVLAARFDDPAVHVDQTVYNPARIWKLYGSVSRKGDHIPERPHRRSQLLEVPSRIQPVTLELLEELAATLKEPDPPRSGFPAGRSQFDMDGFVARYLKARAPVPHEGGRKWVLEVCPFNAEHRAPDSAVFQRVDGSLAFHCFHNSCATMTWRHVRELFEGPRPQANSPKPERPPADEQAPKTGALVVRRLIEIPAEPIKWLWPYRIAKGKLTLLVGHPGLGKSLLTAHLAAVVTAGGLWPLGGVYTTPGDVIFLTAEDDPADTLRPRLEAAGADLNRIHILESVIAGYTGEGRRRVRMFDLQQDIDALSQKLTELADVAVVIIDPISAYMGEGVDSHKNAEVRAALGPFAAVVAGHGVAGIGITHLSKAGGPEVLLRVIGSLAFVAAARAAHLVALDPQDKDRRLCLPIKNNLAPDSSGLAFRIERATISSPAGPIETARVAWEPDPVTITADEAIRPQGPSPDSVLGQAKEWLQWTLRKPTEANEVYARAAKTGISKASIRRASGELTVRKRKTVPDGHWLWSLPEEQGAQGAQGAQDYHVGNVEHLAQETQSTTHDEHLEHVEHLGEFKGLNGPDRLSMLSTLDEHLAKEHPSPDDDQAEVEL